MSSILSDQAIDMLCAIASGAAQKKAAEKYPGMAGQLGHSPRKEKKPELTEAQKKDMLQKKVIKAFTNAGLDPAVGLAIIQHESNWNPNARSHPELRDEQFGGAYGLSQMLPGTARMLGYRGDEIGLMNPDTNIRLLVLNTLRNERKVGSAPADLIAAHNSGKAFANAPRMTREEYIAAAMPHYESWAARTGSANQSAATAPRTVASFEPSYVPPGPNMSLPSGETHDTRTGLTYDAPVSASTAAQMAMLENGGRSVP